MEVLYYKYILHDNLTCYFSKKGSSSTPRTRSTQEGSKEGHLQEGWKEGWCQEGRQEGWSQEGSRQEGSSQEVSNH